jgi:osmotically-inducible protein OsmY
MKRASLVILSLVVAPMLSGCVLLAGAGAVAGVNAVRQERTVGDALDDVRISTEISGRLANQLASNILNLSTTVHEGRVLLTGRTPNEETRVEATRIAWTVEGVRKVDNAIEVTDDVGLIDRPRDIFIQTEIAASLLSDRSIRDVNYTVDVVNGVVYLMGVAQDQAELDRVIARARRFQGVKRVESYVVLKDDPVRFYGGT